LLLGAVSFETGSYEQAEMYLSAALASDPDNVNARLMLAELFIVTGDVDEARRMLEPLEQQQNTDPRVIAIAAKIALSSGETDRAIAELKRGVEAEPLNTATSIQLALALIGSGRQDEVAEVLESLEGLAPESTAFQRNILGVLVMLRDGDAVAARQNAERIAGEWPDESGAHNLVGAIALAAGDVDEARTSFVKALDIDPDNIATRRFLAQIAEREKNYEEAAERYDSILASHPSAIWAMSVRPPRSTASGLAARIVARASASASPPIRTGVRPVRARSAASCA